VIYGVLLSIPAKFVTKYEDEVRKTIGYGIARGDVISFTEARYKGDVAFVPLQQGRGEGRERAQGTADKRQGHRD